MSSIHPQKIIPKHNQSGSPFALRPNPPTDFRMYYNRGDIPIVIQHEASSIQLKWKTPKNTIDMHHYLPLFFEGLRETQYPFAAIAEEGVRDLLSDGGQRIVPVIPQLILPIKAALDTRDELIIAKVLRAIQLLLNADPLVGPALVPYYRNILPVINIFFSKNVNIGDKIYYGQRKNQNIGDLIAQTLELMEIKGGPDALINIRYMIPTYQSAVQ
ncbi:Parkin_co-regulated protein [Hexamita inflata]|uniref:Parkin co-regulated protein n=1 Tax=Hexamita inflata TaxID=28002 RepID=A0AA86PST1_9EUKA|nr:Parkin co-regulated protein [Hexamita inflata]CAI9928901.1 Parkin co-regulated protein [Hexamita inflata]CAI9938707.1 Parkin co-regulated protein [Hexamita inflata]CAI9942888.1 Parkin co-regulated protein [Hexamita inflata]